MKPKDVSSEYSQVEYSSRSPRVAHFQTLITGPLFASTAALLVLLIVWPTFFYPFDRDQNTFAYVAREWNRGALPYQDTWDLKPPLIYALYALFAKGSTNWIDFTFRVRVFDIVVLMLTGVLLAKITRRWTSSAIGLAAATWYAALMLQGGTSYLAQTETWANACIVASILCALNSCDKNVKNSVALLWLFGGGFLAGLAAAFKWPLIILPFPFLLWSTAMVLRSQTGTPKLIRYLLPLACVWSGTLVAPMATWLLLKSLGLDSEYSTIQSLFVGPYTQIPLVWQLPDGRRLEGGTFFQIGMLLLLSIIWLHSRLIPAVLAAIGLWQKTPWKPQAKKAVLCWTLCAFALVLMQRKFLTYHWLVVLPGLSILVSAGLASMQPRKQAFGGLIGVFCALLWIFWQKPTEHRDSLLLAAGYLPSSDWTERFASLRPDYASLEAARYVEHHTKPSDSVFIWGFEPQIYLMSNRRTQTRFFYNLPLAARYAPATWRSELLQNVKQQPPALVLVVQGDQSYIISGVQGDSKRQLQRWPQLHQWLLLHYQYETTIGRFLIYRPRHSD